MSLLVVTTGDITLNSLNPAFPLSGTLAMQLSMR